MGVHALAFSAAGLLASASHDYSVVLWNLERGEAAFLLGGEDAGVSRSRVVFDGSSLFVADGMTWHDERAALRVLSLDAGTTQELLTLDEDLGFTHLERAPGAAGLVALVSDIRATGPSEILRLDAGGRVESRASFEHVVYDACALRDGRLAVVGTDIETDASCVWVVDECATLMSSRALGDEGGACVAAAPHRELLAVACDEGVALLQVHDLREVGRLELGGECASAVAWSPDGRSIAVGTRERRVRMFEASSGRERLG